MKNEVIGFEIDDNTRQVIYLRNGKTIGSAQYGAGNNSIQLRILGNFLVGTEGWYRRDFVSFYRNLPKFIKAFRKLGFWVYGGVYMPNFEKGTLNAAYDNELALAGIAEPKPPKRTYKPRKPKGEVSGQGQEEQVREESLA